MTRLTETIGAADDEAVGAERAYAVVDRHVGTWLPLAWKLVVFYAAWIGSALVARSLVASPEALALVAVAYWFGLLFAAVTVAAGVLVVLTGLLDQRRLTARQAKY